MDWQTHRAHQLSAPESEGLAQLIKEIAPGSRARCVRRLGGGLATATHSMDLQARSGKVLQVVLKRYRQHDETAPLEWDRLTFAYPLPVPSPQPLALDASGEWFGTPALVMRRLSGRPNVWRALPEELGARRASARAPTKLPIAERISRFYSVLMQPSDSQRLTSRFGADALMMIFGCGI